MMSNEVMEILVKEAVTLLMKEDPNWDRGLEGISKEDVMQVMKKKLLKYMQIAGYLL